MSEDDATSATASTPQGSPIKSTLKTRRRRESTSKVNREEPWRTRIVRALVSSIVLFSIISIPILVGVSFIPFAFIGTLPTISVLFGVLVFSVPQLAYLLLAQTDAPPHSPRPFLIGHVYRCLQIDYAVWRWMREAIGVGQRVAYDWIVRKIRKRNYKSFLNIPYGANNPQKKLDVYTPLSVAADMATGPNLLTQEQSSDVPHPSRLPVLIFFPPQIRPLPSQKVVFGSLGANLAEHLGVVTVIPDLTGYPDGRVKNQVEDAKHAIQWVVDHIKDFGGDATKIYLSGHGMGAHLALLMPLQNAVACSRDLFLQNSSGRPHDEELPNGVMDVRVYASGIPFPEIAGLILFAPISNVDSQITSEARAGIQHLSTVRRVLGPGERTCFFHSPSHLVYAARNILDVQFLPKKVLFLHGGLDKTVAHSQSEAMKELLRGVGVPETRVRIYGVGHWGVITPLMCRMHGPDILEEVRQVLWA